MKERSDWTEDGRYPSRFYKTSTAKQQAVTSSVEGETVKGTAGEAAREREQDRKKGQDTTEKEMRTRQIRRVDKHKDPNLPTEQREEVLGISKPSPCFPKSFLKLLLLITGSYSRFFHSTVPLGSEALLGIMGCIFRHSLIHFIEQIRSRGEEFEEKKKKITILCIKKLVFGKGMTKQLA